MQGTLNSVDVFFCSRNRQASGIYDVNSSACHFYAAVCVNKVIHRLGLYYADVHSYCSLLFYDQKECHSHVVCFSKTQHSNVAALSQ